MKQLSQTLMRLEHIKTATHFPHDFPRPSISKESDSVGGSLRGFCGSGPRTTLAFSMGGRTTYQMVERLPRAVRTEEDLTRTDGLAGATNHSLQEIKEIARTTSFRHGNREKQPTLLF